MPHINRIRLVNIAFNDAKFLYDDLILNFNGKSGTVDLINGGGKTVLLTMILQVILPASSLRADKPLKEIFYGGPDRTSHVLVEWLLDEGNIYKYLLTGFCARRKKSQKEGDNNLREEQDKIFFRKDIDYFNYYHLYDRSNEYDIKNWPLSSFDNKREILSYDRLKSLIKEMKHKHTMGDFTHTGEYKKFLRQYNIIDTEWNVIKDINSGENHIEKYFRENKTSRKMIENLLVKIITQIESGKNISSEENATNEENLADTLIELRHNIEESLKKKEHLDEYNEIFKFYSNLERSNDALTEHFRNMDEYKRKAILCLNNLRKLLGELKKDKEEIEININNTGRTIEELNFQKQILHIQKLQLKEKELSEELKEKEEKLLSIDKKIENIENEINISKGQNIYLSCKDMKDRLNKLLIEKQNIHKDNTQLMEEYETAGYNYKLHLNRKIEDYKTAIDSKKEEEKKEKGRKEELEETIKNLTLQQGRKEEELKHRENEKESSTEKSYLCSSFLNNSGFLDYIFSPGRGMEESEEKESTLKSAIDKTDKEIRELNNKLIEYDKEITGIKGERKLIEEKLKSPVSAIEEYNRKKIRTEKLQQIYECREDELIFKISEKNKLLKNKEIYLNLEKKLLCNKIDFLKQNEFYIANEKIIYFFKKIKKKFPDVLKGIDYLENHSEEEKKSILKSYPLLPYSVVLLKHDFKRLKEKKETMEDDFCDYPFPVINLDSIRRKEEILYENIFFLYGKDDFFIDKTRAEIFRNELEDKSSHIKEELEEILEYMETVERDKKFTENFMGDFNKNKVDIVNNSITDLKHNLHGLEEKKKKYEDSVIGNRQKIQELTENKKKNEILLQEVIERKNILIDYVSLQNKEKDIDTHINNIKNDLKKIKQELDCKNNELAKLIDNISQIESELRNSLSEVKMLKDEVIKIGNTPERPLKKLSFEESRTEYESLKNSFGKKRTEVEDLEKEIIEYQRSIENHERQLKDCGVMAEYFIEKEFKGYILRPAYDEDIKKLAESMEKECMEKNIILQTADTVKTEINKLTGKIETKKEDLLKDYIPFDGLNSEDDILRKAKEIEGSIKTYKKDIDNLQKNLTNLVNKTNHFQREEEKYREFIDEHNIKDDNNEKINELIEYEEFKKTVNKIKYAIDNSSNSFSKLIKEILNQEEKFYYINNYIREHKKMVIPAGLTEGENRRKQIRSYLDIINEDIEKTKIDIENLEKIQQNFTMKCVSRAEWLLEKLKWLPELSRINVNGIKRNMLIMNFDDFSEEDRRERMKNHISSIVKEIGNDKKVDREKIKKRLTSRELLSQITNMDRAVVKLYKVENNQAHSTYKRWEDAVGSDGQSNALYFIFAVCIISYIRLLTSENKNIHSRGVIIADNPFGTTSAMYLWEPMFNIIKENNVQLITTGHNINKELISKFEVNYILRQQFMSDNTIRVERDYRTEDDLTYLEFDILKGEQMSLFFSE